MGQTINVTAVTITDHYRDDPSSASVHVGMTKEAAEATAITYLREYLDEYFEGCDVNPFENATTIGELVHWANEELVDEWLEQDVQTHEVAA